MGTIAQALGQSKLDRLDAQLLLLHALGRPVHDRAWLIAHDTDELPADVQSRLDTLAARRLAGEPVAYLLGSKEFFGLELLVDSRVLVPRPDTETLVHWALTCLRDQRQPKVIDLGTGSGAIALALKQNSPTAIVEAVDLSQDALTVARANAQRLNLEVTFHHGTWLQGRSGHYDLIVSNPPYIGQTDPHLRALTHEPHTALVSGADGLDDLRAIVAGAPGHLRPGGWLLLEHGWDQASAVTDLLKAAGFSAIASLADLGGVNRCTGGCWHHP